MFVSAKIKNNAQHHRRQPPQHGLDCWELALECRRHRVQRSPFTQQQQAAQPVIWPPLKLSLAAAVPAGAGPDSIIGTSREWRQEATLATLHSLPRHTRHYYCTALVLVTTQHKLLSARSLFYPFTAILLGPGRCYITPTPALH